MVRLKRVCLTVLLCAVGSAIAADQAETSAAMTEQVIARNIQEIKELIRDTSWTPSLTYNPRAYYDLYESQLFKDKITVRETTLDKGLDYLANLFCVPIHRTWQIGVEKVVTYHLDPLDALSIGIQAANPAIVRASIDLLPYTKAALSSGKTTDFMDHVFVVNGKFKVDQLVETACDACVCRVNALRIRKFGGILFAATLFTPSSIGGYEVPIATIMKALCESVTHKLPLEASKLKTTARATTTGYGLAREAITEHGPKPLLTAQNLCYATAAASTTAAAFWHKLEQIYIGGYISSLELLINSEKTCYDKELTKKRLQQLQTKLTWFGIKRDATKRLQILIGKLS